MNVRILMNRSVKGEDQIRQKHYNRQQSVLPTRGSHFTADGKQVVRSHRGCVLLLHRMFGLRMNILVDRFQFCKQTIEI
jgi:hypothetical protein